MNPNFYFKKLDPSDDFVKVAKLILSHELDYHDMLGEFEENLDVLLLLLKDSDSIFYYNNFYIVKDKFSENLVAIGSFRGFRSINSSPFIYKRAFGKLNKELPSKFQEVFDATFKMYDTMTAGGMMSQIIVDPNYRQQGVGSFLLKNLLNLYGRAPSYLWTGKDNQAAINLYCKFDYEIVDEFDDYSGSGESRKELKMFREGSSVIY